MAFPNIPNHFNIIMQLEKKYGVYIQYRDKFDPDEFDNAACAGNDIFLTEYSNNVIWAVCLCHEIAHHKNASEFRGNYHLMILSKEGAAWEETINILKDNETVFGMIFDLDDYNGEIYVFMKDRFLSYLKDDSMHWEVKVDGKTILG